MVLLIDIVYFAWNRLEFTRFSFERLLENTNWDLVHELVVYDDVSTDGTQDYLVEAIQNSPVPATLRGGVHRGSSVGSLQHYIWDDGESGVLAGDLFATIENDVAVSPGWLDILVGVMERHPELELLGMEPMWSGPPGPEWDGVFTFSTFLHMGGSGIMRGSAFAHRPKFRSQDMWGFEFWQKESLPPPRVGWVAPDLPVCLLDRLLIEPFRSLSHQYMQKGWQRPWAPIPKDMTYYWDWFPK